MEFACVIVFIFSLLVIETAVVFRIIFCSASITDCEFSIISLLDLL